MQSREQFDKAAIGRQVGGVREREFRFPEETIWMILRGFLGEGPQRNPYTKEGMAWKIYDLLPELMEGEKTIFDPVSRYLRSDSDGNERNADRTFRLCRQVSTLYDSYQAYRPEMIMDWESGRLPKGGNLWQGVLWQAVRKAFGQESLPELAHRLQASDEPARDDWLPERLSVFGISTLPPVFLDACRHTGASVLCVSMLCNRLRSWGEVESEKTSKMEGKGPARARFQSGRQVAEEDLSEAGGNFDRIIGRRREFFNLLVDRDAHDAF